MKRPMILLGLGALAATLALLAGVRLYPSSSPDTGYASPAGDLTCTVKDAPCGAGEVEVFRMSGAANAHAQTPATATYPKTVCCSGPAALSTNCSGAYDTVLTLSGSVGDNAHAASDGSYTTQVCLSVGEEGVVGCTTAAACDPEYACVAGISGTTNAHVEDCEEPSYYATKVCCQAVPDNCPTDANPDQRNIDSQDGGDVCDPCANDPTDTCDTQRSAGASIGPEGGSVTTPDDSVTITVPPGALSTDTSISITGGTDTGFKLTTNLGRAVGAFQVDIQPSGTGFATDATIVFRWDDTNNDGWVDDPRIRERNLRIVKDGQVLAGPCRDVPGDCNMDANTFEFTVSSLSEVVLAAPEDTDDDDVPDDFEGVVDNCPLVPNADQADFDADALGDVCDDSDEDGCLDAEDLAMGFDPLAWYDFYDAPVPAVADPDPNGPRNQAVTMGDVLAVLLYVGASPTCPAETTCGEALPPNSPACCTDKPNPNGVDYDIDKDGDTVADGRGYDRSPGPEPNPPWDVGLPNGAVNIGDVLAVLAQVGLDCSGAP